MTELDLADIGAHWLTRYLLGVPEFDVVASDNPTLCEHPSMDGVDDADLHDPTKRWQCLSCRTILVGGVTDGVADLAPETV